MSKRTKLDNALLSENFDDDLINYYSSRPHFNTSEFLFPFESMWEWLTYQRSGERPSYVTNREWSYTLKDDIYLRYKDFDSADAWKKDVQSHTAGKTSKDSLDSKFTKWILELSFLIG